MKRIKDIEQEIHIKWLSKAKTAVIEGDEMTVLPYGYLTQAVNEAITLIIDDIKKEFPVWELSAFYGEEQEAKHRLNTARQEVLNILNNYK